MSTLLLRLAAPLQSWGTDSKFETRRTDRMPSKSGVTGLLAAALGIPRNGNLDRLNQLKMGVRVDKPGEMLCDYHTAHGEKASYITYRYYLSDAVFLVGLESEDKGFLEELEDALKHPAFPLYLGRRSCPPVLPLVLGLSEKALFEALAGRRPLAELPEDGEYQIYLECESDEEMAVPVRDLALTFSPEHRRYGYRAVKECRSMAVIEETSHDAMQELMEEEYVSYENGAGSDK